MKALLGLGAAVLLLALGIYRGFFALDLLDLIYYRVYWRPFSAGAAGLALVLAAVVVLGLQRLAVLRGRGRRLLVCWRPLVLLLPLLWPEPGFWAPLLLVAVLSWTACRVWAELPWAPPDPGERGAWGVLLALTLAVIWWEWYLQQAAYNRLFLHYDDWGIFLNAYDNTLHGRFMFSDVLNRNFLSQHFIPGSLILLPYLALFDSPESFFLLNALILCGPALLFYRLLRTVGCEPRVALALGISYLAFPATTQLSLSLFYGFHPEYLLFPTVFLMLECFFRGRRFAAGVLFLLSLTFKETIPPLYVGVGLVLLAAGRRKLGAGILITALVYFFAVTKLVMPALGGLEDYSMLERFGHLGSGMGEILCSPLTRPTAFWGSLWRRSNLYFPLLLLLPFAPVLCRSRYYLLAGAINLGFLAIVNNAEHQSIALQYQVELVVLIYAVTAVVLRGDSAAQRLRSAGPVLLTSLCCCFFFGLVPGGKNRPDLIFALPEMRGTLEELKATVPPGAGVNYSQRLGAHFLRRNRTVPLYGEPCEYVVLDLNDPLGNPVDLEQFRVDLLRSGRVEVLFNRADRGHHFLVLRRTPGAVALPPTTVTIPGEAWARWGVPIALAPEWRSHFSARLQPGADRLGLGVRIEEVPATDVDCRVTLELASGRVLTLRQPFGLALRPAVLAAPGEVFILWLPRPPDLVRLQLTLEKR